jgi:anti-anti-sigma factor
MTMECSTRRVGDIIILDLKGRLILGEGIRLGPRSNLRLIEAISELAKKGHRKILLNLVSVSHLDSSGVGQLLDALQLARGQEVALKLVNPIGQVNEILKLTKLDAVFEVKEHETAAIESFQRGAEPEPLPPRNSP